jgi:hypothetical protein
MALFLVESMAPLIKIMIPVFSKKPYFFLQAPTIKSTASDRVQSIRLLRGTWLENREYNAMKYRRGFVTG